MKLDRALAVLVFLALFLFATASYAVVLGQVDDFEDGTTQNWYVGMPHPSPPINMSGGPGGPDDNFMLIAAAGGGGPGSRLAVINDVQWAGDYVSAGVLSIEMDLWNASIEDLYIRLLFEDPMGGPPANAAITTAALLPADSGWTHVSFAVGAGDLIALLGDVNTLLSNTTAIRIFHNPDPGYPPPPVIARLGIDNIRASGGPTPTELTSWGRVKSLYR